MLGVFPGDEQTMLQQLLATTLRCVIVQHLLLGTDDREHANQRDQRPSRNRVLASEVMHVNSAVQNLIASNNLVQIRSVLETSRAEGMYTLDSCLAQLWRQRRISESTARSLARNPGMLFEIARAV